MAVVSEACLRRAQSAGQLEGATRKRRHPPLTKYPLRRSLLIWKPVTWKQKVTAAVAQEKQTVCASPVFSWSATSFKPFSATRRWQKTSWRTQAFRRGLKTESLSTKLPSPRSACSKKYRYTSLQWHLTGWIRLTAGLRTNLAHKLDLINSNYIYNYIYIYNLYVYIYIYNISKLGYPEFDGASAFSL